MRQRGEPTGAAVATDSHEGLAGLARRQAELVDALVAGAVIPSGFPSAGFAAARDALARKRAGEVARSWPELAAASGPDWAARFLSWARGRPPLGSLRDGWDYARAHRPEAGPAALELAVRELAWSYDGTRAPVPRCGPALRRVPGGWLVRWRGRVRLLHPSGGR